MRTSKLFLTHVPLSQSGFTLIELMVAVALVTLLAGLSLPWYGDYVRKAEAVQGLRIALPAKTRSTELVILGETQEGLDTAGSGESPNFGYAPSAFGYASGEAPVGGSSTWEVAQTSTGKIKNVIRSGTVIVITFEKALDRLKTTEYYLALYGKVGTSDITWTCGQNSTITNLVDQLRNSGAPVGSAPIPAELTPSVCQA